MADDLEDEFGHEYTVSTEWAKLKIDRTSAGYRDGVPAGKESVSQDAFDAGYKITVPLGARVGVMEGSLRATLANMDKSNTTRSDLADETKHLLKYISDVVSPQVVDNIAQMELDPESTCKTCGRLTWVNDSIDRGETIGYIKEYVEETVGCCRDKHMAVDSTNSACQLTASTSGDIDITADNERVCTEKTNCNVHGNKRKNSINTADCGVGGITHGKVYRDCNVGEITDDTISDCSSGEITNYNSVGLHTGEVISNYKSDKSEMKEKCCCKSIHIDNIEHVISDTEKKVDILLLKYIQ